MQWLQWTRDPLVLFLLLGALIYASAEILAEPEISYSIEISENDLRRLNDQWQMQMRRPPTATELSGLTEQFVREEILYREALRMGLDQNDTIVRRRLVQKLTFLTEDTFAQPLNDEELRAYFESNQEDYRIPALYTFTHRYFSRDRRRDAEQDARAAVENEDLAGDPFMLQTQFSSRSEREIGDLLGREFAAALAALSPADVWQGPLESAYGWHPVRLTGRTETRLPQFNEVRDRVVSDAQQARRKSANETAYARMRALYAITYPSTAQSD